MEGIHPAQPGEAGKNGIGRVENTAAFGCERGEMGVGGRISGGSQFFQAGVQAFEMTLSGIHEVDFPDQEMI